MKMNKMNESVEMLQYQLKRYKAMKNGAACQNIQSKLYKLTSQHN